MTSLGVRRRVAAVLLSLGIFAFATVASAAEGPAPKGRAVMAWHVTIAPAWFDPSSAPAQITPFGMLYAIHDALVRPYPGQKMGPSLAESWEESEDGKEDTVARRCMSAEYEGARPAGVASEDERPV